MSTIGISHTFRTPPPSGDLSSFTSIMGPSQMSLPASIATLSIKTRLELPWRIIRMGGGPRTFPGGVSKWQWKRMQATKAKQLLKARLCRERQMYEMRKRSELRAAVAELERPWEVVERAPNLFSVKADEQLKALADRFQRTGGYDLWTEKDGPQLFHTHDGVPSARFFPKGAVHSVKPYAISGNSDDTVENETGRRSRRRRRRGEPAGVTGVDDELSTDCEGEDDIFLNTGATEERQQIGRREERAFGDPSYQKDSTENRKHSGSLSDSEVVGMDRRFNSGRESKGLSGGRLANNGNLRRNGLKGLYESNSELVVERRVNSGRERKGLSGGRSTNDGTVRRSGSRGMFESNSELGVERRVNDGRERKGLSGGRSTNDGNGRRNGSRGVYESNSELGMERRFNGERERKGLSGGRSTNDGNGRRNGRGVYESNSELGVERKFNGGRGRNGLAGGRLMNSRSLQRNGSRGLYESNSELGVERKFNGGRGRNGLAGGRLMNNRSLQRNGSRGLYESDSEVSVDRRVNGGIERKGISEGYLQWNVSEAFYESDSELGIRGSHGDADGRQR